MSTTSEVSLCWCNNCSKLVTLKTRRRQRSFSSSRCPNCSNGGSIEKITREQLSPSLLNALEIDALEIDENYVLNPDIYIRSNQNTRGGFDCYYDYGLWSGFTLLQPELWSSDNDQLFDDCLNMLPRDDTRNASKAAIASLSTIEIQESHVSSNPHCPICREPFELETKAKEMPVCKHLYHSDCILPWLASHDSCPYCWRQLSPTTSGSTGEDEEEEVVGLVVWRLTCTMVAMGRFSGGERLFEVVFCEEDPTTLEKILAGIDTVVNCTHFLRKLFSCFIM